jgi:hypothetical protein
MADISKPGIALDDCHVAQYVADPPEHAAVVALYRRLATPGATNDQDVQGQVDHRQRKQDRRHPRIEMDGGRNQQNDADHGSKLFTQDR